MAGMNASHGNHMPPVMHAANSPHGKVIMISSREEWDSKFFEATTDGKIVVVDFTASWCGPCKMIAPFFVELSEKNTELIFLKVDVDELNDLSSEMEIRAMPTFVFFKDGKPADRLVGANKNELQKKVTAFATIANQ